ncbi:hypothetical protein G6F50_015990 [Rhizopus delemar]|uniref:Uncharacterized protein n=1 Tax=Rhizopus delemar TaxID=936053 RepID=A0A9P6XV49_9FUNG|nr:hypothetical protein G6F50_015990 [Rhizopus delemar]
MRVDELAEIVARLLRDGDHGPAVMALVGGTEVEYRQMLAVYRASMGFPPPRQVPVPAWLVSGGAMLLNRLPGSLLTRDTWRMLRAGNTADAATTTRALGRAPAGIEG